MPPCRHVGEFPQCVRPEVRPCSTVQEVSCLFSKVVAFIYTYTSVLEMFLSPYLCQYLLILDILIVVNLMSLKLPLRVFMCLSLTIVSLNIFQVCFAYPCCLCEIPIYLFGLFSSNLLCFSISYHFVEFDLLSAVKFLSHLLQTSYPSL